jgi:hypothetical protein
MLPVSVATDSVTTLRIKNHDALAQCCRGFANYQHIDTLIGAYNIAEALCHLDVGPEYLDEIKAANAAVKAMASRARMVFTGPELNAVKLGMEVHEAQLDDSRTTIAVMEEAISIVKKVISKKKAQPA